MTDCKLLSDKIRRVAWGYIFILFNINIETVSIMPKWAGYLMIVGTLAVLSEESPSAKLLRPLGIALAGYCAVEWAMDIFSLSYSLTAISIVVICIRIYFSFQLFTNLADIAEKHSCTQKKSLLNLRTANTVTDVVTNLIMFVVRISVDNDDFSYFIPIAMGIIQLIMMIFICATIFSLAKDIESEADKTAVTENGSSDEAAEYKPEISGEETSDK